MSIGDNIKEIEELESSALMLKAQADIVLKKCYKLKKKLAGVSTPATPSRGTTDAVVVSLITKRNEKLFRKTIKKPASAN